MFCTEHGSKRRTHSSPSRRSRHSEDYSRTFRRQLKSSKTKTTIMDYSVKNSSSLLRDEREGCRSLVCDANGIIIAEMVYRCMICSTVSESISDAKLHYHNNHIDTDIPEVHVPPALLTPSNNPRSTLMSGNNNNRSNDNGSSSSSSLLALDHLRLQQQQRLAQIARHHQESMLFPEDDFSMELPSDDEEEPPQQQPPPVSRSSLQSSSSSKHSSSIRFNSKTNSSSNNNVVHVDPMNLSMNMKTSPSSHSSDNNNMPEYPEHFNVSPKRISCKSLFLALAFLEMPCLPSNSLLVS